VKQLRWIVAAALGVGLCSLATVGVKSQQAQQMFQHGFEGRDLLWQAGPFNAAYKKTDQRLTKETAHSGAQSELIQFNAEKSAEADKGYIYFTCPVGRAPVTDELTVTVWVKANRPGTRLLCRVVLPRERDPKNPDQPLTVLLPGGDIAPGEIYERVGRWQQLSIRQPVKLLQKQQQLLNTELKKEILTADAYVDLVILNVYGGPGDTSVYTDDLEVGPILDMPAAPDPTGKQVQARPAVNRRPGDAGLNDNHRLVINGEPAFMRGIRHTGTPLKALRQAGFNVVWLDETTPPSLIEDAARIGFWIVPTVAPPPAAPATPGGQLDGQLTSLNESFTRKLAPFRAVDAVLAYDLGGNVPYESATLVTRARQAFRSADPQRPVALDAMDGVRYYAGTDKALMLGMHRWPLMTGLEMTGYLDWLTQRRRLAMLGMPETFCWTWVQTHLDDWYTTQIYDRPGASGFNEPVGPQAEQIRLLTYCAVGAGYRGVAYWSDRFLADSHAGRDRLLAMALLNQELQLLEPLLANADEPKWIDTNKPDIKAAMFRTNTALLVIPVWLGTGSQYVPAQGAVPELKITVPQVMGSAQAWTVSPGEVRSLKTERVVGGTAVTLREFSLTGAVVFTSDLSPSGLVAQFQDRQRIMAPDAAKYAHEQAQEELAKVEKVQAELDELGVKLKDGEQLLAKSRAFIESCATNRRNGDYPEAYADAGRALRPLRILMRAQWERAVRELDTPTASPYAVSFFTLPRHWKFYQELTSLKPGSNVLPGGDFELPMDRQMEGWVLDAPQPLDDVVTKAERVTADAKTGKQALMLEMLPTDSVKPPGALERSFVAINSPAVKLPPGSDVQISGWVKIPQKITGSVDGVLFFDSAGGEPLAVRLTDKQKDWKKFTLYRRVPPSGTINVSMVLTGIGRVYFDDVRIEPLIR
jgi:hypothetical protein